MKPRIRVDARAPTRIDLAGGTLDIWPLYLFHPGAMTLNMAIDLRAEVSVRSSSSGGHFRVKERAQKRWVSLPGLGGGAGRGRHALFVHALRYVSPPHGLDVEFFAGAPRGAGLAGSSALLTALCAALYRAAGRAVSRRNIETGFLRVPAGEQDYYPAIWGGVQALRWETGAVIRESIRVPVRELEKRMLLVYTGCSRESGANNWEVYKRHLDGDRRVTNLFRKIAHAAGRMYEALVAEEFDAVGRWMAEDAEARTRLFPGIRTAEIRELERVMKRNGARADKVCGAGGGGCVIVYSTPDIRKRLAGKVEALGYATLPLRTSRSGLTVRSRSV